ncbi:MAG: restriction endonuclease subunit S [Coxiella sp. (in: Bacteria)]|nr:MAG: restriction endonuclease subunit S [Coxiella sp. (in: g-proteobacteria)]
MTAVPEIRFPEFTDDWQIKRIGEIATFQRGFDLPAQDREEGSIPIVSSGGITGFHNIAKVDGPGIVTGRYGSIGELFYMKEPHWPLNTALWVKDFHGNSIDFTFYHLGRVNFKKLSDKTGVPGINRNDLHRLWASTTTLPEQIKIAAFLGSVDDKLDALRRKHDALKQFKAGLMQKLFSQELRFKRDDGSDYPDWEDKRLGDESTSLDHLRVPLKELDRQKRDGEYPYYGASGIIDFVDDYIFDEDIVLLGEDGANILSRSTPLSFLVTGKSWVNNHAHVYRAKGSSYFLAACLENIRYEKYNTGTVQPKLNGESCKNIPLSIPSLTEQQKIADFLSAMDAKTDAVSNQIKLMEDFKKGLLQKMFV